MIDSCERRVVVPIRGVALSDPPRPLAVIHG
jgi:hypothetical protein